MKRLLTIAAVSTLALCGAAFAQTKAPPKPAPEMTQLQIFDGKWVCTGNQHETIFGAAHAIQTIVTGKADLGGFWLLVRYEEKRTRVNDHPTAGVYEYGYDPATKQIVANWTDSIGGYGRQTSKGFDGDKLVLLGDYNSSGQNIGARDTFVKKSAKSVSHLSELQVMGNWVTVQDETCEK